MCDSEDDLSSMSTVPYEFDDDSSDSIYEKETQAIEESDKVENTSIKNRKSIGSLKKGGCNSDAETVLYDGPTQPLKFIDSGLGSNSLISTVEQSTSSQQQQNVDSDCETIPESPVFNKDPLSNKSDFQKLKPQRDSSASSLTDDERTQLLPLEHHVNTFNSTKTQRDCISPEIPLYEGPTQRLLIKNHITPNCSQENIASTSKAGQTISDFDTLPMSLYNFHTEESSEVDRKIGPRRESIRSETPIYDGPTQPLPVTRSLTKANSVPKATFVSSTDILASPVRRTSASSNMDIEDDDQTQVIPELLQSFERGPSSVGTVIQDAETEEILSDSEYLPPSPIHHLNSTLEIPSTQNNEDKRPLQGSDVWGCLKKVDNWDSESADSCPLSPDLLERTVASPCPELDAARNSTIESGKDNDDQDPNDSRRDPTIEMDRATIPASPVFDFDDSHIEQGDEETQVLSPPRYQGSPAFVAETPFVPTGMVSEDILIVAETPFVVDVESPLNSGGIEKKKRKIIRRSGHACRQLLPEAANSSIHHRTSTPQDMDVESTKEDERSIDDAASVESDFELTFASHYSALPTLAASTSSTEGSYPKEPPFVGFEAIEVEEPTNHLKQIRQVINNDQMKFMAEQKTSDKVSSQLPLPPSTTAIAGPSTAKLPAPRRSTRKPVPNTRRTFDIEPNRELTETVTKRRPGRPAKATIKIEVQSSNEDSSEPVTAVKRKPVRLLKVEVNSSDEDVSEPIVTAIKRRPGRPPKVEVNSSNEEVSEPIVTAIKRRPGRPPKVEVQSTIPNEFRANKKSVIRKAVSMPLSDATESGEEAANQRTSRNTRVQPSMTPQAVKQKSRNPVKEEPIDDSLLESALNKTTVGARRRSKRGGVNNNTDDMSVTSSVSVGSNSPSIQEATRRRKRALAGQVRVLFTAINDEGEHDKIVESLGGRVVSTFKDCSVLVTDRVRRTLKFLCCVGLGTPIVGVEWLTTCRSNRKFVDPWLHLLIDKAGEEKFDFKLSASLEVAKETPLLSGWIFHATPSVMPKPVEMQEIVESCGGIYFEESDNSVDDNKIVISCESDKQLWPKWKKRCATLVDKEAILSGVLQQSFEPDKFKLDA